MHERAWPSIAARYRALLPAPASPVFEGVQGLAFVLDTVAVHRSALYAEASNGAVAISVARNENWVSGVGPGWYPTDTYFSRYRPVWGMDSLVASGCFIRRVVPPWLLVLG
jgi:hypothetical protein